MDIQDAAVVKYLESIIYPLIAYPDSLKISHGVDERGVILKVDLHAEDMGKIIGRQGETSKSIRNILRVYGGAHKMMVSMLINEPDGSTRPAYKPRYDRETTER